ncbi:hypothetical protein V2I01_05010 [Micromonospora sp. BRA006-A]|nr:hypothetical protein [Micromonospora sp. BRA006-A]
MRTAAAAISAAARASRWMRLRRLAAWLARARSAYQALTRAATRRLSSAGSVAARTPSGSTSRVSFALRVAGAP